MTHGTCTEYFVSECILSLVNNYFDKIENCSVIQNIISNMYKTTTKQYYKTLAMIYFIGFVIPFLDLIWRSIKVVSDEERIIQFDNEKLNLNLCLFTQLLFMWIEGIQLYTYGRTYLEDFWNKVDIFNFLCFYLFYFLRMWHNNGPRFTPIGYWEKFNEAEQHKVDIDSVLSDEHPLDHFRLRRIATASTVTALLIVSILLKTFSFLKVFPSVGSFIQIFYKMLEASQYFTYVFLLWILAFSLLYMVVGIKVEDPTSDYGFDYGKQETGAIFLRYIILSFKNSVSGPEDPTDNFWTNLDWNKR